MQFVSKLAETTYQKGIIEGYNTVTATFTVNIILITRDLLHTSHVSVEVTLDPELRRPCEKPIRNNTIVGCFVILFSMLTFIAYSLSVLRAIRLARVCTQLLVI